MGNLGKPGDMYTPGHPIYDWVSSWFSGRNKFKPRPSKPPKAPREPRNRSPWSDLGEAVEGHQYGGAAEGFGAGTGGEPNPPVKEEYIDRANPTQEPPRPPIEVTNNKTAAGNFSDTLFNAENNSQADSGSGLGGDAALSERVPGKQDGVWATKNGPFPELSKDDPRPVWHPDRSEAWVQNAQGYHEDLGNPLETDYILQSFLADTGYDPGEVDGYFGPKSKAALEKYQGDRGMEVTGTMNDETRASISKTVSEHGDDELWR